jgi:Glycosyl transferase family 2
MSPYASVIIPTHDRAATLATAVASVQRQTVADIEIIIVGDGPTPDVTAAAQALGGADPRVRFLVCEKGPRDAGVNVDRAIHEARSERIFYNDDDDIWLPQHIETIGPHLDHAHVADTLPVSVGKLQIGAQQQLHGTLVNHGNDRMRELLAEDRLKLTFDTHIAHRKSAYIELGSPRAARSGISVHVFLSALAAGRGIRWTTIPTTTALSLHGAARRGATPSERRSEIESWLAQSASWTPAMLLERADFTWHAMRTWLTEAPRATDSIADYLVRYGIAWEPADTVRAGENGALTVSLDERQRGALDLAFNLFQGRAHCAELPDRLLVALLDGVLGGIQPGFALRILRPLGTSTALKTCAAARRRHAEDAFLIDLLEAYLMLADGDFAQARVRADRLANDDRLPPYDCIRVRAQCDLAVGAVDAAIERLEATWMEPTTPTEAGLELANLLMRAGRLSKATAVCRKLEARVSSSELTQIIGILDHAWAALDAVPHYRLSGSGVLLKPDGSAAAISRKVRGRVEVMHVEHDLVCLRGWAVDLRMRRPAVLVVALVEGTARGAAAPVMQRPDVARALKLPEVATSGYLMAARVPSGLVPGRGDLRVFAIAADGAARELRFATASSSQGGGWRQSAWLALRYARRLVVRLRRTCAPVWRATRPSAR